MGFLDKTKDSWPAILWRFLRQEEYKWNRINTGYIVTWISAYLHFIILPELLKPVYIWLSENYSYDFVQFDLKYYFHIMLWFGINGYWWVIYHFDPAWLRKYRSNDRAWPWNENPEKWRTHRTKTLKQLVFNVGIFGLFLVNLEKYSTKDGLMVAAKSDPKDLPGSFEICWQLLWVMVWNDFAFYISHRILHMKRFYWIHKQHHEYNVTVSYAAEYANPVEYLFANIIPGIVGFMLLQGNTHVFTVYLWMLFGIIYTHEDHSGYELPWSPFRVLPTGATQAYHDYHHSHNVGNFGGIFVTFDSLFGTNDHYFRYIKKWENEHLFNKKAVEDKKKEKQNGLEAEKVRKASNSQPQKSQRGETHYSSRLQTLAIEMID